MNRKIVLIGMPVIRAFFILSIVVGLSLPFNSVEAVQKVELPYVLSGNSVIQSDDNIYIEATPATLYSSGWVEVTFWTKGYEGPVDVVYGFNGIDGVQAVEQEAFESEGKGKGDAVWRNKKRAEKETFSYADAKSWDVVQHKTVAKYASQTVRVWIEIPFSGKDEISGKYNIGVKPSNLSLEQAKDQGKLWLLDPWYSASWGYRKSVTVTNPSADYQTLIRVYYGAGTDISFDDRDPDGAGTYTADAGTNATTIVDAALTSAANDYYNGARVYNSTRALWGVVTDYVGATKTVTCTSIAAQASGDTYYFTNIPAGVYLGSHSQTDFDDLRFAGADEVTLLDYWIEAKTDSDVAWVWLQNDATPSATNYIYYGNAGASVPNTSHNMGVATFIKFEDFEWGADGDNLNTSGGSITWTVAAAGTSRAEIDSAQFYSGSRSGRFYRDGVNNARGYFSQVAGTACAIRYRLRKDETSSAQFGHGNGTNLIYNLAEADEDLSYYNNVGVQTDTGINITVSTWSLLEISSINHAAGTYNWYFNGTSGTNTSTLIANATMGALVSFNNQLMFENVAGTSEAWIDNIIVRKWDAIEPSYGSWGVEAAGPSCALAGTITTANPGHIIAGGRTIILTLTNANWVAAGGVFDAQRQNIINGMVSAGAEAHGWDIEVVGTIPVTDVVRTGDTVVTITLSACPAYYITANETITVTVPATATDAGIAIVAAPTFTISLVAPTVTTGLCTGTGTNWAIVNGNVTDAGWPPVVTARGFNYGLTAGYGTTSSTAGSFTAGTFSGLITGLAPATTYHYRAFATNLGGTGVGADATFTTTGATTCHTVYETADTGNASVYGINWLSQTFTTPAGIPYTVKSASIKAHKVLAPPGAVNLSIYRATGGFPQGQPLASGSFLASLLSTSDSWIGCDMTEEYSLEPNTTYALVVSSPTSTSTDYVVWRNVAAGGYTGGASATSANNGTDWGAVGPDQVFRICGNLCLQIQDAKVFQSYKDTGDWLVAVRYINLYPPYYDTYDVRKYFDIQLVDSSGNLKGQSAMTAWGNRVGTIYMSATTVSALTYGGDYRVRLYGKFTGNPYIEYALQSTDWLGDDLTNLDSWVITSASVIGAYYGEALTTYIAERGEVLNAQGGAIFSTGINGLGNIRPEIFQIYTRPIQYDPQTSTQTFRIAISNWQVNWGPDGVVMLTRIGNLFGVDGNIIATWFTIIAVIALAAIGFSPGHTTAANILSIPIFFGAIFLGFDWIYIAVIGIVASFLFVKNQWIDK
jgi:hypothetical protein